MMPVFQLPYKDEWMVDKGTNEEQLSCMPTSMEAAKRQTRQAERSREAGAFRRQKHTVSRCITEDQASLIGEW
jgi:hypothetical protein